MIVYEDDLGNPIPIFYHEATDLHGCKLEADLRKEIEDYREESSLLTASEERGEAWRDAIVPIPNTADVLGILKGDITFTSRYKRIGEFTREESAISMEFRTNYTALLTDELEKLERYDPHQGGPDD